MKPEVGFSRGFRTAARSGAGHVGTHAAAVRESDLATAMQFNEFNE
jgi:hypothetical protein